MSTLTNLCDYASTFFARSRILRSIFLIPYKSSLPGQEAYVFKRYKLGHTCKAEGDANYHYLVLSLQSEAMKTGFNKGTCYRQ